MSTSHTILDRRHSAPVVPAADLRSGDTFLDQDTGRHLTVVTAGIVDDTVQVWCHGRRLVHLDPSQLVNLEGNR